MARIALKGKAKAPAPTTSSVEEMEPVPVPLPDEDDEELDEDDLDEEDDDEDEDEDETWEDPPEEPAASMASGLMPQEAARQARANRMEATAYQEARALPPIPGRKINFAEMQMWLKLLTPEARQRISVTVYRTYPSIDGRKFDPTAPKFIEKYDGTEDNPRLPIPEDDFRELHGGGSYLFYVNDMEGGRRGSGESSQLFEAVLKIPYTELMPRFDHRLLRNPREYPSNKGYWDFAIRNGIIDEEGNVISGRKGQAQEEPKDPTTVMVEKVMRQNEMLMGKLINPGRKEEDIQGRALEQVVAMMGTASQKSLEMVMANTPKAEDPIKQLTGVALLLKELKGSDSGNMEAIKMLMQQQQTMTQFMLEMTKAREKEGGTMGPLRELLEITDLLGLRQSKGSMLETVLDRAAPVALKVLDVIQTSMAVKAGMAPPAPSMSGVPTVVNPGAPVAPVVEGESDMGLQARLVIGQYGNLILKALREGKSGADFADGIQDLVGIEIQKKIAGIGVMALVDAAKSVPEFWALASAYGEPYIQEWVTQFCNYDPIEYARQFQDEEGA